MKVLIACEESQAVCKAFRELGHEAYSCDILSCSGGHPEWHILCDVKHVLNGHGLFRLENGDCVISTKCWDLIIAHPPCTYLSLAGNRWFDEEKYGDKARQRKRDRESAVEFFMLFVNAPCEKIAIENPYGTISTAYRKPDQTVQPYHFGHDSRKPTCLWLKGLPYLKPTNIVEPKIIKLPTGRVDSAWHIETWNLPKAQRSIQRSKTFPGIARAMAEQWGGVA